MSITEKEELMEKAATKLGEVMAACPPGEKEILRNIKAEIEKFASQKEKEGIVIDRSSQYVLAILMNEQLAPNEALMTAGKDFIDAEYEFVKAMKEAVEKKG